jgi:hypothetical protein
MISVAVSSSNGLFLTLHEVERLAEIVQQELICRPSDQIDNPVMVADFCLTVAEAWKLVDVLEDVAVEEAVDWADEGF